jgi:ABC-type nitrate/sulfonate/bicarbonate transport system permease component
MSGYIIAFCLGLLIGIILGRFARGGKDNHVQ